MWAKSAGSPQGDLFEKRLARRGRRILHRLARKQALKPGFPGGAFASLVTSNTHVTSFV